MRIVNGISEREGCYLGIREREERWKKHYFSGVHTLKLKQKHTDEVYREGKQR